MIGFALLLFPFLLLGFVLLMARVEEPLNQVAPERDLETFLEGANREELEHFVRHGTESAVSRFRERLRFGRRRDAGHAASPERVLSEPPSRR